MPSANVITAHQNSILDAMQQSASIHQNQLQNQMQPGAYYQAAIESQFNSFANAAAHPQTGPNPYFIGRAKSCADQGDKIINRMAFLIGALGPLSKPIVGRMALKLERIADEVESFVRMAT